MTRISRPSTPAVRGLIVRADAEHPSNYRALLALDAWLKKHNIPAVAGIDTRALTSMIREKGMPHGVVVNCGPSGDCDQDALIAQAKSFAGLEGLDLAKDVTSHPDQQVGRDALGLGRRLQQGGAKRASVSRSSTMA